MLFHASLEPEIYGIRFLACGAIAVESASTQQPNHDAKCGIKWLG